MRKDLATHGKHGKQKKVRNKENKEKAKLKIKQRYEKDRTCLLIVTINYKSCLPPRTKIKIWKENRSKEKS